VEAKVACLYVNAADRVAIAAGPVTNSVGEDWGLGDGMLFVMRDSPDGDGFALSTIHDLEDWPGQPDLNWVELFCANEFLYDVFVDDLWALTAGDIVIFGIDSIDDVIGDFDAGVAAGDLVAVGGQGNLSAFRNKLTNIAKWLESGNTGAACIALLEAQQRSDGLTPPKDWVAGSAVEQPADSISNLIAHHDC